MYLHTKFRTFLAPDADTSTATLEPPKKQEVAEGHVGALGGGFKINPVLADVKLEDPDKKEEGKEEPEGKITKGEVVVPQGVPEKLSHKNFAEVVAARKKVEEELAVERKARADEKAQWEEERKKVVLPEAFKTDYEKLKAERDRLDADFKSAFADRQLRAEYGPKRDKAVERLATIAQAAGDQSVQAAVSRWDYDKLAEFAEDGTLTPGQKRDWNRALEDVSRLDEEMGEKLKNTEATFAEFQQRNQQEFANQSKARIQQHVSMAEGVHAKLLEAVPALRSAPELASQIKSDLVALAGGEGNERFPAEAIMQTVAEHRVLENLAKKQAESLTELKKKVEEQESTIKKLKGPGFGHDYVEEETNGKEDKHVGFFGGGIRVSTGR